MCCADTPDSTNQERVAAVNERIAMRQLDLTEEQAALNSDLQREFMDLARANSETDAEIKDFQFGVAQDEYERRQNIFNPLEAQLVGEAEAYDSPERIALEMGKADGAVLQAYEKAVGSAGRDQLRRGINPNSAKSLALRENAAVDIAAAAGNASTQAGERAKAKGFGMRMDAAGLGRGISTNQTAAAEASLRAGQSAVGSIQSGVQQQNNNYNAVHAGFGSAGGALNNASRIYGGIADTEAAVESSNNQAIGTVIGAAMMM